MVVSLSDKYSVSSAPRFPDQVAAILARDIRERVYSPGNRIPSESRLADMFGVSRTVVREALSQLKYEGLLESRQGKGIIVMRPEGRRSFCVRGIENLPLKDLAALYEMRAVLECETAAIAARRRSRSQLARLRSCLKKMAKAVEMGGDGSAPDLSFHNVIAEASGNNYLRDLMGYVNEKIVRVIQAARDHSSLVPNLPQTVQTEHEAIYKAIAESKPDEARRMALRHLCNAAKRLGIPVLEERPGDSFWSGV